MRLEIFLLFLLFGGLFGMFILIPVCLIFGVWNYALANMAGAPHIGIGTSFIIYCMIVGSIHLLKKYI